MITAHQDYWALDSFAAFILAETYVSLGLTLQMRGGRSPIAWPILLLFWRTFC